MPDSATPTLTVSRAELTTVAKRLKKLATARRLNSGEVVVSFDDGALILDVPGGRDAVPATGRWPGRVRVPARLVLLFALGEPEVDPVVLSYRDGFLHVHTGASTIKLKAHREDISPPRIEVPLNASDREYLQLPLRYPKDQIVSSGLDKQVKTAETLFQRKLDRAFPIFSPYGITREHLEHAIRALILRPRDVAS